MGTNLVHMQWEILLVAKDCVEYLFVSKGIYIELTQQLYISKPALGCTELYRSVYCHRFGRKVPSRQ